MKNKGIKQLIICDLISKGVDFNQDAFQLSSTVKNLLADAAKECKYRKPETSYFGLGGAFFLNLQKIYQKDRLFNEQF